MTDPQIQEARAEVIDAFARSAEVLEFNQSHGRLYGVLFFATEPLSLDDLVNRTGYSKSTASSVMQDLQALRMVERTSTPDSGRRVYFEAQRDFWQVAEELLQQYMTRELRMMTAGLDAAEDQLESLDSEQATHDLERIRELQEVYVQLERLLTALDHTSLEELVQAFEESYDPT
ncbi:GbsR/MarR family transcriptional regulator [Halolamina sp. C58]|uniref:GbsR/MarR family transcriptional regulator n=1 Tax=Halolamina sp. C58 TaxID=3421640 RepID=UPI003EB7873E